MKIGKGINWKFIAGVATGVVVIGAVAGVIELGGLMFLGRALHPTRAAVHRGYYG
jgi:hypothetical protein